MTSICFLFFNFHWLQNLPVIGINTNILSCVYCFECISYITHMFLLQKSNWNTKCNIPYLSQTLFSHGATLSSGTSRSNMVVKLKCSCKYRSHINLFKYFNLDFSLLEEHVVKGQIWYHQRVRGWSLRGVSSNEKRGVPHWQKKIQLVDKSFLTQSPVQILTQHPQQSTTTTLKSLQQLTWILCWCVTRMIALNCMCVILSLIYSKNHP